jgi:hypothetical protein
MRCNAMQWRAGGNRAEQGQSDDRTTTETESETESMMLSEGSEKKKEERDMTGSPVLCPVLEWMPSASRGT